MQANHFFRVRQPALIILAATMLIGASSTWAASGQFTYVTGRVELTTTSSSVPVQAMAGTEVNPGDRIVTFLIVIL